MDARQSKDFKIPSLVEFLNTRKLGRYVPNMKKYGFLTVESLLVLEDLEFETMAGMVHIRPGHQAKLKRELKELKEELESAEPTEMKPTLNRMNSLMSHFNTQFEGDVPFYEFSEAVLTQDEKIVVKFLEQHWRNTKLLRYFFKEQFKIQTKQALRELSEGDVDTIMWLRDQYWGVNRDMKQPLPFSDSPTNFVKHLFTVEKTIRKLSYLFAIVEPVTPVRGFLSRKEACNLLKGEDSGTFFFRLSNSTPTALCVDYNRGGAGGKSHVRHKLIHMTDRDSFIEFCFKNMSRLEYVYEDGEEDESEDSKYGVAASPPSKGKILPFKYGAAVGVESQKSSKKSHTCSLKFMLEKILNERYIAIVDASDKKNRSLYGVQNIDGIDENPSAPTMHKRGSSFSSFEGGIYDNSRGSTKYASIEDLEILPEKLLNDIKQHHNTSLSQLKKLDSS